MDLEFNQMVDLEFNQMVELTTKLFADFTDFSFLNSRAEPPPSI